MVPLEVECDEVATRAGGPRRGLGVLTLLLAAWGFFAVALGDVPAVGGSLAALLSLMVSTAMFASGGVEPTRLAGAPASIELDDRRLVVRWKGGRSLTWAREELLGGWRTEDGGDHVCVLRAGGGRVLTARWPGPLPAEMLVERATGDRAVSFPLDTTARRDVEAWVYLAALFGLPLASIFVVHLAELHEWANPMALCGCLVAAAAVMLWYASRSMPSPSITVGSDGLRWRSPWPRHLGYAEMAAVTRDDALVHLEVGDQHVRLAFGTAKVATAFERHVEAERAAFAAAPPSLDLSRLERAGKSPEEWRKTLARVLDEADYRHQALDRDVLLRIAEDARAEPERRVAATLALSTQADDHPRLRVAADRCAHPALRTALLRAAEGEVDLRAVEAATRARRDA